MPEAKPVVLELKNVVFNGTFCDEYAEGSLRDSGDIIITAEAETVHAVTQFLLSVVAEEEQEAAV